MRSVFLIAGAAVYAFSAPLGERAGLDTREVGYALALASFLGLTGALAATKLNVRLGRAIPILLSCAGFSVVVLVLCLWRDFAGYLFALIASLMIYYFSTPYFFGLAAALDRTGRWAAAAGSIYLLGFAAGPLVAGTAIAAAGYPRVRSRNCRQPTARRGGYSGTLGTRKRRWSVMLVSRCSA
jgi:predicted MFS family arabinose efflux permease